APFSRSPTTSSYAQFPTDSPPDSCLRESRDDRESLTQPDLSRTRVQLPAQPLAGLSPSQLHRRNASRHKESPAALARLVVETRSSGCRVVMRVLVVCLRDAQRSRGVSYPEFPHSSGSQQPHTRFLDQIPAV